MTRLFHLSQFPQNLPTTSPKPPQLQLSNPPSPLHLQSEMTKASTLLHPTPPPPLRLKTTRMTPQNPNLNFPPNWPVDGARNPNLRLGNGNTCRLITWVSSRNNVVLSFGSFAKLVMARANGFCPITKVRLQRELF